MNARRGVSLGLALLAFAAGFSLDDLRSLRVPGYLLGAGVSLVLIAFGPLWMGRRMVADHRDDTEQAFEARAARARRAGSLALLGCALLFAVWLAVFSQGVPPWAA
jgi:hypothetical protein